MIDLQEHRVIVESGLVQIQRNLTEARKRLEDLEAIEQRQIGAMQMIDTLIAEENESDAESPA